jgi:dolichol-phosphate mannosyltransferase
MTLTVVSPTFNEAQNVQQLIDELEAVLRGIDYEILIVDDDSPDLTWKRVEEIGQTHPRVKVLRRRSDRGLTPAVIAGFTYAQSDVVACIDGDLQHDPSVLPKMLRQVMTGADLVVGSRYLPNGGVGQWHWSRHLMSWGAVKLTRLFLGTVALRKVSTVRSGDDDAAD